MLGNNLDEATMELLKKQQDLLDNSVITINNIVKGFQKSIRLIVIVNAIALTAILGTFFYNYFHMDYSNEIKEKNSNYNYNENVNRNINN
jgi:hypothetical protein